MCPCYSAIVIGCTKYEGTRQIATSNVSIRNNSNSVRSRARLNTCSWYTITHGYNMYDPWKCLCIQTNPTKLLFPTYMVDRDCRVVYLMRNKQHRLCVFIINKHVMTIY